MAYTQAWDETTPLGSAAANTLDTIIQQLKRDMRERLNEIFVDFTTDPAVLKSLFPRVLYQAAELFTSSLSEVSLASFSVPANTLAVNAQLLRITVVGRTNGVGSNGPVIVKFGATNVANFTINANSRFELVAHVVRTAAAAQLAIGRITRTEVSTPVDVQHTAPAETLSGAVLVDIRGNVGSSGTLEVVGVMIERLST